MDKIALDKYLTNMPDDGFDNWCEQIVNKIPDEIFNSNEDYFTESSGDFNWLLNTWFNKGYEIDQVIEEIKIIFKK
jgi:hypothetical protein